MATTKRTKKTKLIITADPDNWELATRAAKSVIPKLSENPLIAVRFENGLTFSVTKNKASISVFELK